MTMWTGFPAARAAISTDVLVGLDVANANSRFNVDSLLLVANNLDDVDDIETAFDNLSPLTTAGDLLTFAAGTNARLAIGANGTFLCPTAGAPAYVNAAAARANLGLSTSSDVVFASLTTTGINKSSVTNAITAYSGGGQGSAVALTAAINRVTTVAAPADSVKLPAAAVGLSVTVINAAASNAMNCFPASGDAINALSPDTAISITAGTSMTFRCAVVGVWNN